MAEVTVDVAGRSYRLGCDEGEEAHVTGLAAMLDAEAGALQRQFGHMAEGRLLMMTALMVADRLSEAEEQSELAERKLAETKRLADSRAKSAGMFDPEREAELTQRINGLVAQIERMGGAAAGA
jgi:cell division protein ZapA